VIPTRGQSDFAIALYRRRSERDLKPADLATAVRISEDYLHKIEAGVRHPSPDVVMSLTEALGIPPDEWIPLYLATDPSVTDLCSIASQLSAIKHPRLVRRLLLAALTRARDSERGRALGDIYRQLGNLCFSQGRYWRAERFYRGMEEVYGHRPDSRGYAVALYNHALILTRTGRPLAALRHLDEAEAISRRLRDHDREGRIEAVRGYILLQSSSYQEARACYTRATKLLADAGMRVEAALGVAVCTWSLDGPERALPLFEALLPKATEPIQRRKIHHNLAVIHRQVGQLDAAIAQTEAAMPSQEGDGLPALTAATLVEKALCLLLADRSDEARKALRSFRGLSKASEPQDAVAARILGVLVGNPPDKDPLSVEWRDDYERRVTAALALLTTQARTASPTTYRQLREAT
jgi:tetratricopeptide (TPR) repeat protein